MNSAADTTESLTSLTFQAYFTELMCTLDGSGKVFSACLRSFHIMGLKTHGLAPIPWIKNTNTWSCLAKTLSAAAWPADRADDRDMIV